METQKEVSCDVSEYTIQWKPSIFCCGGRERGRETLNKRGCMSVCGRESEGGGRGKGSRK